MILSSSTYLDAFANLQATAEQFSVLSQTTSVPIEAQNNAQSVLGPLFGNSAFAAVVAPAIPPTAPDPTTITLALILNRAPDESGNPADPMKLLSKPWAERAAELADQTKIWETYGANAADYASAVNGITTALGADLTPTANPFTLAADAGYLSTVANRTIWLTLNSAQFEDLFDTPLLTVTPPGGSAVPVWGTLLSLPDTFGDAVGGVWIEQDTRLPAPAVMNSAPVTPTLLADGWLGIGNGNDSSNATPAAVAANYSFPLSVPPVPTAIVTTKPIALIESNLPELYWPSNPSTLLDPYNAYRQQLGVGPLTANEFEVFTMSNSQTAGWDDSEFSLDISVIAGAAPTSSLLIYGYFNAATASGEITGTAFNAYQRAFFTTGTAGTAPVVSSSYPVASQPTANSPFQWAWQQLFIDGALANVSTHVSAGDQGSSANIANGLANVPNSQAAPMALAVGGTSIANLYTAVNQDATLATLVQLALQGDPATIFPLVAAGLLTLPSNLPNVQAPDLLAPDANLQGDVLTKLVESVWQRLSLTPAGTGFPAGTLVSSFGENQTGVGGPVNGVPIPTYQSNFGLSALTGALRGSPDVAALAGGDTRYAVLNGDYVTGTAGALPVSGVAGTSAAAPLWASLTAQLNAVLQDQRLTTYDLGYYNDLLYTAAAIAPASFNDIQLGNNINSFYNSPTPTGYYNDGTSDSYMVPTGQGSSAMQGYDMASGLGTPNGVLLARALSTIINDQLYYGTVPDVLDSNGSGGWTSGTGQSLLFQTMSGDGASVSVGIGAGGLAYQSAASGAFAWTMQLAQQSLQAGFDPALVRMFDKYGQGAVAQSFVASNASLSVAIDGSAADAIQGTLSSAFGFADFVSTGGVVRVARPIAVAETVGGLDNQMAVVRVRQNGQDNTSLTFYQVDDYAGTINGVAPGQAGYIQQAQAATYALASGGTALAGPGYGNYTQSMLLDVDAGDLIAMALVNQTSGNLYWGFSQANGDGAGHLWSYGLNTWGWEDLYGGGDRDFNDLIVQLDFTSTAGQGLLV
jgi:hypothetical protein